MQQTIQLKPLLRWAGSKYNQPAVYERLQSAWSQLPANSTYISLFAGALGDVLRVRPKHAVIGDLNWILIEFYEFARSNVDFVQLNPLEPYLTVRERFNKLVLTGEDIIYSRADWAQLCLDFYRLNRTSFNGLWRLNSSGLFNVPEGTTPRKEPLTLKSVDFSPFREAALDWHFYCWDWQDTLTEFTSLDSALVYADPPYDKNFTEYTSDGFGWDDQVKLAEALATASKQHPVFASNSATDRIVELYTRLGFTIEIIQCRRSISCNGDRKKVPEMIAYRGY